MAELRSGNIRIAYYYDFPDGSTFRYRVYNMIQALRSQPASYSASWFCRADRHWFNQIVDSADILVLCRARYTDKLNHMITRARNMGRQVVFDVDDLVVDPDYTHLLVHTLDKDMESDSVWEQWFGDIGRLAAVLRLCDRVITTNEYLASRIRACSGKEVRIVPNFINREQLDVSLHILNAKKASRFARDGRIHLGYFSGSPSHDKDFELISGALARVLSEDPRLRLRVVGYLNVKGPVLHHQDRIERVPMQDFLNLQCMIGSTEINLVPLQDNVFTNCKSELKYFEAGIVGTNTVASPTFTFRQAIKDGINGYLAGSYEWQSKLSLAIDSLDAGSEAYIQMAECAFRDCQRKYSTDALLPAISSALFGGSDIQQLGNQRADYRNVQTSMKTA